MEENTISIKNKRKDLLKWAGWLNIISSIGFLIYGFLVMTLDFSASAEELLSAGFTYEEIEAMQIFLEGSMKSVLGIGLIIVAGVLILFGVKQLKYAKIYQDNEFAETKNLLIAILSLFFGNTISGILGIIAHFTKNSDHQNSIHLTTDAERTSADEMQAKILKLKEMYANGEITLEEYTNLMDKLTF